MVPGSDTVKTWLFATGMAAAMAERTVNWEISIAFISIVGQD